MSHFFVEKINGLEVLSPSTPHTHKFIELFLHRHSLERRRMKEDVLRRKNQPC